MHGDCSHGHMPMAPWVLTGRHGAVQTMNGLMAGSDLHSVHLTLASRHPVWSSPSLAVGHSPEVKQWDHRVPFWSLRMELPPSPSHCPQGASWTAEALGQSLETSGVIKSLGASSRVPTAVMWLRPRVLGLRARRHPRGLACSAHLPAARRWQGLQGPSCLQPGHAVGSQEP